MFYVYAHTKPGGEIFYIGKGTRRRAWSKSGRNKYWHNVINKYGYEVTVLADELQENEAIEEEAKLIEHFKKFNCLVNMLDRGDISPMSHPEVLAKIRSKENREIQRQHSLSNGAVERCKQMAVDPAMIEKRRASAIGKKRTEETKRKMSEAKNNKKRAFFVNQILFDSINAFAKQTNTYKTTIRRWLNDNRIDKLEEVLNASLH